MGKLVASSLEEQHGNLHVKKMLSALVRRLARRMKWKSKEDESAYSGQRWGGLCLRSHPTAKRLSASEKRELRPKARSFLYCGANGCMRQLWPIRAFRAPLHIRKLIS